MTEGYAGLLPAFQSGDLVRLALGAAQRLPSAPDLPTIAKASEALRAALEMADVREPLADRGAFVRPMSPDEVTAFIRDQQARIADHAIHRLDQLLPWNWKIQPARLAA